MRAAIYARVSTSDKGQEVEQQLPDLREFVARLGGQVVMEFLDEESGGSVGLHGVDYEAKIDLSKVRSLTIELCRRQTATRTQLRRTRLCNHAGSTSSAQLLPALSTAISALRASE